MSNPPPQNSKNAPTANQFEARKSSTGFNCSMTGYVQMVMEITQLVLGVITLYKEIIVSLLPKNRALSLNYFYQGLSGASAWLGYAVSALYFLALDQGFGDDLCEVSGYGFVVINTLYQIIDFAPSKDAQV